MTSIYVLKDPRTNEIRYVGRTMYPNKRKWAHLHGKAKDSKKGKGIKELRELGLIPIFVIIEETDRTYGRSKEKYWIEEYHNKGCNLTNYYFVEGDKFYFGNRKAFKK